MAVIITWQHKPNLLLRSMPITTAADDNIVTSCFIYDRPLVEWERSGSVVECLAGDGGVAGLSLTGGTVLCP